MGRSRYVGSKRGRSSFRPAKEQLERRAGKIVRRSSSDSKHDTKLLGSPSELDAPYPGELHLKKRTKEERVMKDPRALYFVVDATPIGPRFATKD
jgi:hypothetical protein